MADASSAGDEGSSTDCIVNSANERNESPALAVGAEPSTTSSSTLAKVDSIVTAVLGAEREPTKTAYANMLADRLKRSPGQQELEGNTIRHIKLKSELVITECLPQGA